MSKEERDTRAQNIVFQLNNGYKSMIDLAQEYKITRERVSQIYYKTIGKTSRGLLKTNRKKRMAILVQARLDAVKFMCAGCGSPVLQRDNIVTRKFCKDCSYLRCKKLRLMDRLTKCAQCNTSFHPLYKAKTNKVGDFCSRICYFTYIRKNKVDLRHYGQRETIGVASA